MIETIIIASFTLIANAATAWYAKKRADKVKIDLATSIQISEASLRSHIVDENDQMESLLKRLIVFVDTKAKATEQHIQDSKEHILDHFKQHSDRLAEATDHLKIQANNLHDQSIQKGVGSHGRLPRTTPDRNS